MPIAVGTTYVFKNISGKRISGLQSGIPIMEPDDEFSLKESQVQPALFSLVDQGMLSSTPALPPDLLIRATSINWADPEWRKLMDMLKSAETKIVFDGSAPTVGAIAGYVDVNIFVQDTNSITNKTDSDEEVDIEVDSGSILEVSGFIAIVSPGKLRAKFSSGVIQVRVNRSTAGNQVISISNPKTDGLNVADTHTIAWS